jgi:hypothetical protein
MLQSQYEYLIGVVLLAFGGQSPASTQPDQSRILRYPVPHLSSQAKVTTLHTFLQCRTRHARRSSPIPARMRISSFYRPSRATMDTLL